ncbi:AAA family ATPase [Acidaminococcus massiliensis]|uniref:AAA family ATPase n=1 Tax=Acidaminococcus massiliensis TaxID=1852375 RepID=UPI00248EF12A|nr:AAA family ATPase [Acidaminococcus massiliensis]
MRNKKYDTSSTAESLGYLNNKDVKFKYITELYIQKFRSLKDRTLQLGKYITVITGKNGTMKSSLLGLIAHPFSSPNNAKDLYGKPLKTDMRTVFRLSLEKDTEEYIYYLRALTTQDEKLSEPIRVYRREEEQRHRITVGSNNEGGRGNFALNTSMINLSRLYPIIETNSQVVSDDLTDSEKQQISRDYYNIMQRDAFKKFESVTDKKNKNTCGPKDTYYDFRTISSGEDNLGSILYKLLAFKRASTEDKCLQGIICIDEFEASLHPVTQTRLFDFLLKWCKSNHMQIIITTHSLYLIYHCLSLQQASNYEPNSIAITNISTIQVGEDHNYKFIANPNYKTIYKELTYINPEDAPLYKVNIICEDQEAKRLLKKILGAKIVKEVEIVTDVSGQNGSSCTGLISLAKNGVRLLDDSIIVLDADVDEKQYSRLKFKYITKLYDPNNLCIEKSVVNYILSCKGDESLFKDTELAAVRAQLSDCGIDSSRIHSQSTDKYKAWHNAHKNFYQKALAAFFKANKSGFEKCKNDILSMINQRRLNKGLDPIN